MAYEAQRQYAGVAGDRPAAGRGAQDRPAAGTRPRRPPARSAPRRNRATTAISPSPTWCRSPSTEAQVERIRASLGELPAALRTRLEQTYGITPYDSDVLVNQGRAAGGLLRRAGRGSAATASWPATGSSRTCSGRSTSSTSASSSFPLRPQAAGRADRRRSAPARLDTSRGREVLADMIAAGRSLERDPCRPWASQRSTTRDAGRPLPRAAGRQPQDRRRSQGRQAQGRRPADRPGQEEEPQRQSQPDSRSCVSN